MKSRPFRMRKTPFMMVTCLGSWLALVAHYDPLLAPLFDSIHSPAGRGLLVLALLWINLVWFYGMFHLAGVLFSLFSPRLPSAPLGGPAPGPVAVLHTICDDFDERAARACADQDYPNVRVFLLDDSSQRDVRLRVDAFAAAHPGRCFVVRRPNRDGFKAGNLNHALRTAARECTHFAIVDADEVLPRDFLQRSLGCFALDDRIGFVQGNHRYSRTPVSRFADDMSRGVDLHWGLFLPARNAGGFVMFYGHGAVIRRDVWERVGGFPEMVSEDIAFAARAREHGFFGVFQRDLVAEESFPASYRQFLRRELKVLRGTLEFLIGPAHTFLRSRVVSWVEKVDCVASCLVLFLPVVFLVFLLVADVTLPWLIAGERVLKLFGSTASPVTTASNLEALDAGLRHLWTWDFYLLTLFTIVSPLIYQALAFVRSPRAVARYTLQSTAVFLSIIPALALGTVSALRRRVAVFHSTGNAQAAPGEDSRWGAAVSIALGTVLFVAAILTSNLALLTVAVSFAMHALFMSRHWDTRAVRLASLVPFLFFIAVFGAIPLVALGVAGAMAAAMPAHH